MKNSDYWKERFRQLEAAQNQEGAAVRAELERQYRRAERELEWKIRAWYQRLADNNGVSMAEARRMLSTHELKEFRWDVWEYIRCGQENKLDGRWMKELENASARFHISRLEALKLQTQQSLEIMFGNQLDNVDAAMKRIYLDGYYHTAYELQKGFGIGWDIAGIDQCRVEKVIRKPWAADGKNFSERIWGSRQKLIGEVHNELTQNILLGAGPQKAVDAISQKMKNSRYNAGRLVMTEEAYFSSAAQKDCFDELGVEQYEIVATLDSHTSEICRSLDGKVFPMKDYQAGVTAPPFHVFCRSTTVPYFEDDFGQTGERAAKGEDGKTYYVPADMTYEEWKKSFVDGSKKSVSDIEKSLNPDIIKLSEEELAVIKKYKSFESYLINEALRASHSIEDLNPIQKSFVKQLDTALLKVPRFSGNLIRTVDFSDWPDCAERTEKFANEFVIGKLIQINQYWSTSKRVGYNDHAGIQIFILDSRRGRDISKIGLDEKEVLYERESKFVVISRKFYNGTWNILLQEA